MDYLERDYDISNLSNYKLPSKAKYFFQCTDISQTDKLFEIYEFARREDLKVLVVSGGTNMLFAFDHYPWIVVQLSLYGYKYDVSSQMLTAQGSESIWSLSEKLINDYRQHRWKRFLWLPGSIAGAVYGNAGCFGLEIKHNFHSCDVLDIYTGKLSTIVKDDMDFEYRSSRIKKRKDKIILRASFDLSLQDERYHSESDPLYFREYKQPKGNTCGSFFKNPKVNIADFWKKYPELYDEKIKAISAGFLLENSGMKWSSIGGAYFSEKHANFLMHDGKGNYKDMLELIKRAQEAVMKKFSIELENEVQIIQ